VVANVSEERAASIFRIKGLKTVLQPRTQKSTFSSPENPKSPQEKKRELKMMCSYLQQPVTKKNHDLEESSRKISSMAEVI
jgi:hypothetical protein